MEYIDEEDIAAMLINIDFEKAFDYLEWDFVEYCLKTFNFGDSLMQWIKTFYTDVECCVLNNGWTTHMFKLSKGARQGCPLSPYIFIICAELLACMIRQNEEIEGITINGNKYLISQYADDTNIFIKYSEENLRKIIDSFRTFQIMSGLKVNLDKTEIVPLGPIRQNYIQLLVNEQLKWTTDPIKCLGVIISTNRDQMIDLNYTPIINKMKTITHFWNKQYMTIFGKVVIINSFLISQFVYLMSVLPTPPLHIVKQIDAQLYTFLWSNKTERIKRAILKNTKHFGGISMPDIILKDKGLKINWVKRLGLSHYLSEFLYISTWINNTDIWKCNVEAKDIDALFRKTPNKFNRDILNAWAHYSFHTPKTTLEIRNQFIWFNSHIKINGKPTFHNIIYNAGITHVKHLLNQYGNILKYHDFIQKYGTHINYLNYFSIVSAIPASWKVILLENNYDNQATYMHSFDRIRSTKSKICKLVYMNMLTPIVQQPDKVFNKWKNYFNNDLSIDDWLNSFEIIYNCTKFIDLHFFHFKMLPWQIMKHYINGH